MKYKSIKPNSSIAKQNPSPPADCPLVSPLTIILKKSPSKNPPKLPTANKSPTADPSPTGKTNSHPSYSIMGTSGIRKKELNADIKLATTRLSVSNKG